MESIRELYYMFNMGYVIIFALLAVLTIFMYMPKDDEYRNYRKSRYILGGGFALMALYCIFRLVVPQMYSDFEHFWTLIFVSLIFSWLNYTAFLCLINSDYKILRSFFIDGIAPGILIGIIGILGHFITSIQSVAIVILGVIFIVKCIWMFYTAENEWRKVNRGLMEVYDESPNINWMRRLVWLTFLLSVGTLCSWYFPKTHLVYDVVAPFVYFYMVFKLVNYYPKKIDEMRKGNMALTQEAPVKDSPVSKNLQALEPKVQAWVENKHYCRPNLTIKDVALEIGTNHNYLSKYLNTCLNISFQVWLNTLRIEESKSILTSENISIEEVGAKVGIPLSYNYSRWFKIVTGETPFRYRQNSVKPS